MAPTHALLTDWYDEHRTFVWGLCYRITGSAADADDLVQETYMRALEHGPDRLDDARSWLTRVAVNAARDVLRRRRRREYVGPWLPTPIAVSTGDVAPSAEPLVDGRLMPEARYGLLESVTFAFLHALEALTPTQRAVLLLRDVFDYSAAEVADVLKLAEGNVRTIHHRARRAMRAYDRHRAVPTAANRERTSRVLQRFLELLQAGDVDGIERLLAEDVTVVADAGGEFTALLQPLIGAAKAARLFMRLAASRSGRPRVSVRTVNGFPAAIIEFAAAPQPGRRPPRLLLSVDVGADGLISAFRMLASPAKLAALTARR